MSSSRWAFAPTEVGRTSNVKTCPRGRPRSHVLITSPVAGSYSAIVQGAVSADHVHVLLSCPPTLSPSKIMQYIKGKTSRKLMMEFKHVQKQYWGRHFWARGYFVATSGNVTDEAIAEYIRGQEGTEPSEGDDNFQVTPS